MAVRTGYRAMERTVTTGTGTYDLGGAEPGYQTLVAAIGSGNTCRYVVTDGLAWEINDGVVTDASPDTLTRATLIASSTGSAISWGAGTKSIYLLPPEAGRLLSRQILTSGTTYTTPTGVRRIRVIAVGGGGAGGGATSTVSGQVSFGNGGGAAGYCEKIIDNPSASYTYAIGAGGTGVSAASGNNGGDTTFGTGPILTAGKGFGGGLVTAGSSQQVQNGGLGGSATGGDINIPGMVGKSLLRFSATEGYAGEGGSGPLGTGGKPNAGSAQNGFDAQGWGAGGGGALSSNDPAFVGGAGTQGVIIVEEYS